MDARCVVVWMALEDAVIENGCMWFVPGSHRLGALEVDDPNGNLTLADQPRDQAIKQCGKVPIELKAGKAIFFSDLVIHISPPNVTVDRSRKAYSMTFAPAEVKLHPDTRSNNSPVLCCGENVEGNWNLIPPPT
jgi:ectoine hydroxylase-related dioxygenase (phytanoyl-CoA dioxygenase family)